MTLLELLTSSLRAIGVKNPGVTLTAEEVDDAKEILNLMLDLWSAEGLMVYASTRESFSLVNGQEAYTIGTGGNFNTDRPIQILNAYIGESGAADTPVEIIGANQYQGIWLKETPGKPDKLNFLGTMPLGTIYIYPSPDSAYTIYLDSLKPLTDITVLTSTISLPPGYEAALQSNLAVNLAPEYGRDPSQLVLKAAMESKKALMNLNAASRIDPVNLQYGDYSDYSQTILTG
jgi:hypothetical protein